MILNPVTTHKSTKKKEPDGLRRLTGTGRKYVLHLQEKVTKRWCGAMERYLVGDAEVGDVRGDVSECLIKCKKHTPRTCFADENIQGCHPRIRLTSEPAPVTLDPRPLIEPSGSKAGA